MGKQCHEQPETIPTMTKAFEDQHLGEKTEPGEEDGGPDGGEASVSPTLSIPFTG